MAGKKKKKKKIQVGKSGFGKLQTQIVNLLDRNISIAFSAKQVAKKLKAKDIASKHMVSAILFQLKDEGKILQLRNGSFKSSREPDYVTGTVDYVNAKFGYIQSPEMQEDVWVPSERMNFAMDGDEVRVMVLPQHRKGRRPEGRVMEVVKRSRDEFVGRLEMNPGYAFVVPDNRKMHTDIFVKIEDLKGARDNDKVIIKIVEWPSHDKNPRGTVTEVLGQAGEHEAEIHSIVAEFGLPLRFPGSILEAAEKINDSISKSEIEKRRDFRNITTITIDPEDAKDFDDALSIRTLPNGNHEVGIHIADVSHYLKDNSPLDQEAYKRATSVYLVDRTIPMLPERLSNNLCSLNPEEDKLTFSAVFELDNNAHVKSEWFGRTVIHSDKRFSYEEAQEIIENVKGPFTKELTILNELALKLRVERFMRGSINFETTEVKFKLDEKGRPIAIIPKIRKDAHKMIEDFMLLANKKVAEFVTKKGKGRKNTFVYRIHDFPDPDKIHAFSIFAKKFGHKMNTDQDAISTSLNKLIEDIEDTPEQNVLQNLAIRSMAKAKYTTERSGHFGLAFAHYTHFTSPIRRYPDVMVHRLLDHYLKGGESPAEQKFEEKCKHSSEMEVKAAEAERASIKFKQVEYIETVKDREFDGVVSGVTEYGIFVEMTENKCEGMIRVSAMTDDYYTFDEDNYRLIGKRSKNTITLGDNVKVKVTGTDIDRRTIDLAFVDPEH